ncbi:MAG: enolase C-terminal domain-like protein [Candidatus Pacearchaeota archaeon]
MQIKAVDAKTILDSRGEQTVKVSVKTDVGEFSASSPSGKSTGKYEAKPYKTSLTKDIENLKQCSDYFADEVLEKFDDLRRVEDVVKGHVGANTTIALEYAALKGMAYEQGVEPWQIVNPDASKKSPRLVGNCVGGGQHSENIEGKKPDFQEFLLIPDEGSAKKNWTRNKKAKKDVENWLREANKYFEGQKNDEDAWMTPLNERKVLDVLNKSQIPLGLDVAASAFYKRKKYDYRNPALKRTAEEQMEYLSNLIQNFELYYIEDPFEEGDFESHAKLLEKFPDSLIVGDDLTVTNPKRLQKAIDANAINALIVKPNQVGSLIQVQEVCEIADKNGIKKVFSHRSGETEEDILSDLAFGFDAEFFKAGITGRERETKMKRLVEIEESLK